MLAAAGTKWNFLRFQPGLVGGHCIGVDPYYLTAKAEQIGYRPEVILSGRRINDGMGSYVAQQVIKRLANHDLPLKNARVGILGLTFKENVPDIRNSKVVDIYRELCSYGVDAMVHDPRAEPDEAAREYGISLSSIEAFSDLHALILAVPHACYEALEPAALNAMIVEGGAFIDIKCKVSPSLLRCDIEYWSL